MGEHISVLCEAHKPSNLHPSISTTDLLIKVDEVLNNQVDRADKNLLFG